MSVIMFMSVNLKPSRISTMM